MKEENYKLETKALHAGYDSKENNKACAVPIYQTASYLFDDTEHAANLFGLSQFGNIYTRIMNPTTDVLEKRVAALDGGVAALAVSSGQSAITLSLLNIAKAGDEIVADKNLYGGTYTLLKYTLAKFGIKVNFVDVNDNDALKAAINDKTKAVYAETIGNPRLTVCDLEVVANTAHQNGIPFIVDNTFAPYLCRPIEFGADIVVYSATKYLCGHGNSIGGVIVDSGKFDWTNGKFPLIAGDDPSYHDVDFVEHLKPMGNIAYIVKARVCLLRDLGTALSPFNAFLILQGIETLHVRMERHVENATKVAQFLQECDAVSWVNYPTLKDSKEKERAEKYLSKGASAMIGFGLKGGKEAGAKFIDSLELVSHLANVGDAKTLAIHPASTTHQQLSEKEQQEGGVTPDFVRLSVGIENAEDIIKDLKQAIVKASE